MSLRGAEAPKQSHGCLEIASLTLAMTQKNPAPWLDGAGFLLVLDLSNSQQRVECLLRVIGRERSRRLFAADHRGAIAAKDIDVFAGEGFGRLS